MSVRIYIACDDSEKIRVEYECYCVYEEKADPNCDECHGTGRYIVESSEFELSMYNTRFRQFCRTITWNVDVVGIATPASLLPFIESPEAPMYANLFPRHWEGFVKIVREAIRQQHLIKWG